jgi:signal transduction histidine kinase
MPTQSSTLTDGPAARRKTGDEPEPGAAADPIDILDAVEAPVVVLRGDSTLARFNRAAAGQLCLSPADIGRACRDVAAFAGLPELGEQCSEAIDSGADLRAEFRYDGKWLVVRICPYRESGSHVAGAVLTFTNVTALRASIDQTMYERECANAILDVVRDPLVVLTEDQQIDFANRAFYTMFYDLPRLPAQLKEMIAGRHPFQPVRVDHVIAEEGQRTLLLDARPLSLPDHSDRRVLVSFRDITAGETAEAINDLRAIAERREELRRSEAFLAEAQRLSLTGSFSWRVATDELRWSDQLYRIFGFDQGTPVTFALIESRFHEDDISSLRETVEWARGDGADFEYEHRLLMPDQSIRYLHMVAHATRDENGRLEYIGAVQDVTARRLADQALGKAQAELAHVARITTLSTLTASTTHEVSQPLSGIVTNGSVCLRMLGADPPDVEGACAAARRTIRDANRAADVIARMRALFSNKEPTGESVDLNSATQEVIALSSSELERNRVLLRSEFAEELPTVAGERVPLQQVILNLLRNAVDAMLGVDDRPRRLLIRTEAADDGVRVTVRDAGEGLGHTSMDKLFDAFYTTKADGMGIGLSVSRSIVERHRGRLWAEPNDGPGATFSFWVPCDADRDMSGAPL